MKFKELKEKYSNRGGAFPSDKARPNLEDLNNIIENYNCTFPQSFIDYQTKWCNEVSMGDMSWDGFGWANKTLPAYMNLEEIVKDYRDMNYPDYLIPFKEDNGDYYCFDYRTEAIEPKVVIFDHNSNNIVQDKNYQWESFIDWLDKTML